MKTARITSIELMEVKSRDEIIDMLKLHGFDVKEPLNIKVEIDLETGDRIYTQK